MSEPQSPVISESSAHYAVLVLKGVAPSRENRAALAAIPQRVEEVAALDSGVRLESLVALGPGAYAAMSPSSRPGSLRPFEPLRGRRHVAPATQGDVLVFLQSSRRDLVFEAMLRVRRTLPRGATSIEEIHGFRYLENRDLSGFKDGSANPPPEERLAVATVGAEDPDFEGGSYVIAMRFVHDLDAVRAMDVATRERMIGRRLDTDEELPEDEKPADSHVSRMEIERDGVELEIHRKSFPYGTTAEHGLYFIAFARDLSIYESMLRRQFGLAGDGLTDRLLEFTRPVSGGFYFAPSRAALAAL